MFTIAENISIKKPLPKHGVACTNAQRAKRLLALLKNPVLHTDSWGCLVYTGFVAGFPLFLATVSLGSGASFSFHEMFAAGCDYLVRYGSDDRSVTLADIDAFSLVTVTDNLQGLPMALHDTAHTAFTPLPASPRLLKAFRASAEAKQRRIREVVCHHIEDYHRAVFPALCETDAMALAVSEHLRAIEQAYPSDTLHAWDMESAVLFYCAQHWKKDAITVLQAVLKPRGNDLGYEGQVGKTAFEMEPLFLDWIVGAFQQVS